MRLYRKEKAGISAEQSPKNDYNQFVCKISPYRKNEKNICIWAIQFYFLSQFKDKMLNSLGWGGSLQRDPSSAYI